MKSIRPTAATPEGTDPSCGFFTLGLASALAIGIGAGALYLGISVDLIEKAMVVAAAPWFAYLYFLCRKMHRTKIVWTD